METHEVGSSSMVISALSEAMKNASKRFTDGERSMLIDVFNGTMLSALSLGQHMLVGIEDSFDLYPGMYEDKWHVNKDDFIAKIKSLDTYTLALVELWAASFWTVEPHNLEVYLEGNANLSEHLATLELV